MPKRISSPKRRKSSPRKVYISACDTGSTNFTLGFLNVHTFDCFIFKHNFKVNNPELKTLTSIQNAVFKEVLEYHKDLFERTMFFAVEANHHRVIKEVERVFTVLTSMLRGRYSSLPQYVMTGREVRSSYNIPPNKSHRARKKMSADSCILNTTQNEILHKAFSGKVDDAHDVLNLAFAVYRKYYLMPASGMQGTEWKNVKVENIIKHKRMMLEDERQKRKRAKTLTITKKN